MLKHYINDVKVFMYSDIVVSGEKYCSIVFMMRPNLKQSTSLSFSIQKLFTKNIEILSYNTGSSIVQMYLLKAILNTGSIRSMLI